MSDANAIMQKAPRLIIIDLGKGIGALALILVHTMWMFSDPGTQTDSAMGQTLHLFNQGVAAFLVWMGMALMMSRTQSFRSDLFRGVMILVLAYMLNFLKFTLCVFYQPALQKPTVICCANRWFSAFWS